MSNKTKIAILAAGAVILAALFVFYDIGSNWGYILPRRMQKVLAIIFTGSAIAFSTVIFQTITNNRILTPSIIGLDSLYLLIQTFLIYVFGSTSFFITNANVNFLLSVGMMILFAALLYKFLFKREGNHNIHLLLLVGIIFGTFFDSLSSFMQVLIDPNEFMIVQDTMFASFNNINTDLLFAAFLTIVLVSLYFARLYKYMDVLALGKDHAINLGVEYDAVAKRLLFLVAVLISVATALVGPITFLSLLVANVAYELFKTYRHSYLIVGAMLISIVVLVGGQFIVEKVFVFSTPLAVIINFVGGVYFIYLLLKESKSW